MWSTYLVLKTAISYTLYGSIKTGQFIVTTVYAVITNCLHFLNKLLTLLTVIIEDFTIFLQDVTQSLNGILTGISNVCDRTIANALMLWQSIIHFLQVMYASVLLLCNTGFDGAAAITSGIKNIFIFIKQCIIMFGEGVWFIVIFIPETIISLFMFLVSYTKNLYEQVQNGAYTYVRHLHNSVLESVFNCYQFLNDIPTESVIGIIIALCFLYIFLQFYTTLYGHLRNKFVLLLDALKLKYNQLKGTVNRILSSNREVAPAVSLNYRYEERSSTKATDDGACIICQDHPRSILILPCRHLCLCASCTPRLMRYSGCCPICRKRIISTMKIYT